MGNSLVLLPECLKIRAIATPVCGLLRNDRLLSNSPIGGIYTKKFRTSISVTIMIFAEIGGYFAGATANEAMGGAILFAMIAGIGCLVYAIDNQKE